MVAPGARLHQHLGEIAADRTATDNRDFLANKGGFTDKVAFDAKAQICFGACHPVQSYFLGLFVHHLAKKCGAETRLRRSDQFERGGELGRPADDGIWRGRSKEHTSELQSLMRISYAVFCLKKQNMKAETYYRHKLKKNK